MLRSSRLSSVMVALGLGAALPLSTLAAPQSSGSSAAQSSSSELAEVVVTGSRIKRATLETLEPAQVITAEYLEERGLTNVADALNELVSYGVGTTPEGAQAGFGTGVNFVNRFSLGSSRTLTLVNGRRFVSSNPPTLFGPAGPGLQVDLNAIPSVLIDRVESIAVGGAPTYGSDAIAGTVNVILKDRYEGVRVFGQGGMTVDQGDAENFSMGLVAGQNFLDDRANITVSIQHSEQRGLLARDRERFAAGYSFAPNPSAAAVAFFQPTRTPATDGRINKNIPFNTSSSDGIPAEVLIANRRIGEITYGGLILPTSLYTGFGNIAGFGPRGNTYLQFNPQGELVPYNPGTYFGFSVYAGGDGATLVDASQVTSDLKRSTFNLFANIDATDNVTAFFEGTAYRGESLELVDQWGYNSFLFSGSSAAITIPSTHPLLSAQARGVLAANGITSFSLQRAHRDLQTNNGRGETDLLRGVLGLRGNFEAADRTFDWEVSANFGSSRATSYSQQINRQRFANALNVTVGPTGSIVCNPAGTIRAGGLLPVADAACVPLDIFGEGRPSFEARGYVSSIETVETKLDQTVFNANIGGELFDTWAGPISFNVGAERRKEEGAFIPNAYLQAGLGRSAALTPTNGFFKTTEFFGEFIIPLAAPDNDWTLLRRVNLVGKARSVDNTINGRFTTSTFGLQYQPIEGLELRGNVTRSLRAPSIVELFLPAAQAFAFISHPCDARNITAQGTTRYTNCQQFFRQYNITPPFTFIAQSASTLGTSSGNPNLLNEQADSWTAGFVFRPTFIEGLQVSADWIDIEIKDVITSLSATQIVTACFDATSYPNNDFCPRIQYTSAGQANGWSAGYVNGNLLTVAGLVAQIDYRFDLADLGFSSDAGKMGLRLDWYYEDSAYQITAVGARTDYPGVIGEPRNQVVLSANYQKGPFGATWQSQYTDRGVYLRTFTVENRDILGIDDYLLHNASLSWRLNSDKTVARLAISNVFDVEPPFPTSGVGAYDILGRRFSVSVSHDF